MCHYLNNKSMIKLTGSSNLGHAICCKPGYFGTDKESICDSNEKENHICSNPAVGAITPKSTLNFTSILSKGDLNH